MACGICVNKLALKLIDHHRRNLDLVRALELAEKAVERYERNNSKSEVLNDTIQIQVVHSLSQAEKDALSFDPDYTQSCNLTVVSLGICSDGGVTCASIADCHNTNTDCSHSGTGCPAPLANSSLVNTTCVWTAKANCNACIGITHKCSSSYQCQNPTGLCYYSCNTGYFWNGAACELIATSVTEGDGLTWKIS